MRHPFATLVSLIAVAGLALTTVLVSTSQAQPLAAGVHVAADDGDQRPGPAQWSARKFRQGKMGSKDFKMKAYFVDADIPTISRIIKRRIGRKLYPDKVQLTRAQRGRAARVFRDWKRDSDCVGDGTYNPYTSGFSVCTYDNAHQEDEEDVRDGITVGLCILPSGVSAAVGMPNFWVFAGSFTCLWGFYRSKTG